ncbi:MFS transporter [Paraburkholderia acidisoli]|uniref:MFS transporter n=1 Tax=Paraburkholderia acidisoli TaxID=2571748 RepID=A0A7Z2GP63_9BURK|nr:MFS transporter [Paraburkholderia acidisoli]QGZ65416.1 MFS transporter [Paraburkholderia acidisoli]
MSSSRSPALEAAAPLAAPHIAEVQSKVARRILPLLFLGYVLAFLDRINIGFAQISMSHELNLTPQQYGFGAAIFYAGYLIFQVPSNLLLEKAGARRTLSRIMVLWGVCSGAMAFIGSATHLYAVRFALGAAEAGFFPGVLLYLTYWFPAGQRARMMSIFMLPLAFAGFIGGPLSGWIIGNMPATLGMKGWHWMFLIEAAPSIVLGLLLFVTLPDGPRDARWLDDRERELIRASLDEAAPHTRVQDGARTSFWALLARPRVYALFVAYFALNAGITTIGAFLPAIIKSSGYATADFEIGLLVAVPYLVAAVTMYFSCRSADRTRSRLICPAAFALAAIGYLGAAWLHGIGGFGLALVMMVAGVLSGYPLFWATASDMLPRGSAAGGIGLVSAVGIAGAFCAPLAVGKITALTGLYTGSLLLMGALMAIGAVALFIVRRHATV